MAIVDASEPTFLWLAASAGDAAIGNQLALSASFATGTTHSFGRVFRPIPLVDSATNRLQFQQTHSFEDGDELTYNSQAGAPIGGLENGRTYFVVNSDEGSLQLATESRRTGDSARRNARQRYANTRSERCQSQVP